MFDFFVNICIILIKAYFPPVVLMYVVLPNADQMQKNLKCTVNINLGLYSKKTPAKIKQEVKWTKWRNTDMNEPNAGKLTQEDGAKLYRQPKQ